MTQGARTTTFDFDSLGRVQTLTGPDSRVVSFSYDSSNRVVGETLPGNREVALGQDASGNLTSLAPPGRPAHDFQYSLDDLLSTYTPPSAASTGLLATTYTYDLDGALTQVLLPDESTIVPSYDEAGRLAAVTTSRGVSELGYDFAGRVESVSSPGGTLVYAYDGPLVTSETASGVVPGTVGWTYDSDFRVASTSVNGASVSYQYDADSLLTTTGALTIARAPATGRISGTTLGGVTTGHTYNDYGELTTFTASASGSTAYSYFFTRDLAGRITGKTESVQGISTTYVYGFDDAGRLASVTRNGQQTASYLYDDNGNRLSKTAGGATEAGSYDDQDRMYSYGDATYAYRPNGELTTKTVAGQSTWYDYDAVGNLRAVNLPDSRQIEYVVDGLNRRIGKRLNGSLVEGFLYEGQLRPIAWLNGSGSVYARFVYGLHVNVPEYMVTAEGTFRFITDHLGSPRLVVNASTGAVVQRIDYDEWGQVLADSNPGFQPFGFAGGLYDRDTGLVRFGARDYDPAVGRWTGKDPVGFEGGLNFYEYCGGDPVNWVDPEGLWIGQYPPYPPGYNPATWHEAQQWWNGKWYLEGPDGTKYTVHPEDKGHWRHWDFKKPGGGGGRWPSNSFKRRPLQKKLNENQCDADPSGNDPQWLPPDYKPPERVICTDAGCVGPDGRPSPGPYVTPIIDMPIGPIWSPSWGPMPLPAMP